MKPVVDMDKVARALGLERGIKISSRGGYFGAMQLAAEVAAIRRDGDAERLEAPVESSLAGNTLFESGTHFESNCDLTASTDFTVRAA